MKRLSELWNKVDDMAVEIVSSVGAWAIWHLWADSPEKRMNLFLGILSFVAVAGFFYAIGTDVGEASVLSQQCAAMCNVPESIRP